MLFPVLWNVDVACANDVQDNIIIRCVQALLDGTHYETPN